MTAKPGTVVVKKDGEAYSAHPPLTEEYIDSLRRANAALTQPVISFEVLIAYWEAKAPSTWEIDL